MKMKNNTTHHQSHPTNNVECQVTHLDHAEGLRDMKERKKSFYKILCSCIEGKDTEKYYPEK